MNRIFFIVALVAAAVIGASWYVHGSKTRAMNSGDVFVRNLPEDNPKAEAPTATSANHPADSQKPAAHRPEISGVVPLSPHIAAQETQTVGLAPTPTSDTLERNPPNGMTFTGAGKYQLYRQGDITWLMDTETGQACVLLATENQWRNMLVYRHGCGGS